MNIIKKTEREKRLKIANQMIKIISDYGCRFFYSEKTGNVAFLKFKKNRLYFVSEYSGKEIYLHYRYWKFHHGGTLRSLINALKDYIYSKKLLPLNYLGPWPDWICNGDLWGYGDDMEKVRKECKVLIEN